MANPRSTNLAFMRVESAALHVEPDRDVPIQPVVHTFHIDKRAHCDGAEVRGDGVVQIPGALHGVSAELNGLDKVTLVVRAPAVCTFDVVSVGGPLDKVVKARIPHLPKVGGNGGQADAKVVNDVAGVIHAAPIRIVVGLTPVPNLRATRCPQRPWCSGTATCKRLSHWLNNTGSPSHATLSTTSPWRSHHMEFPPPISTSKSMVAWASIGLANVIGDVQKQVVVQDVKTVASAMLGPMS